MSKIQSEVAELFQELAADQWVAECWKDMRRRWSRREYCRVEDYLPRQHATTVPLSVLLDLVYGEYILTKEYGLPVDHAAFYRRFPQLEPALRRQFAVDDALSEDVPDAFQSTLAGSTPGPATAEGPIPERIGKYVVVGRIGLGGQAEIFRAVHPALGKEVVLKRTRPALAGGGAERTRLETEARILARIEHPHLARIFDLDFQDERPFLVMEYIRGRTLEQYVEQELPTPRQAAELVAKIARGVMVAHRQGVVHLDIKPSNVLIDEKSQPRLIDFGLAHLEDAWHEEVLEPDSLRGTLHFMAPEQARGAAGEIGCSSDIFALGGLLYFLLTGHPPYPRGLSFEELLERCRRGQWEQQRLDARQIPRRIRHICRRAMSTLPRQRYSNAESLARDLESAFRLRPTRRRSALIGAALLLLILAAASLVTFRRSGRLPPTQWAAPQSADLAIQIWDQEQYRDLVQTSPARTGDQLKITATIPPGLCFTLFSFSSEGTLEEIERGQSGAQPLAYRFPRQNGAVPLVGASGTELVLLCGRTSRPIHAAELQQLWPLDQPFARLPDLAVMRLTPAGVTAEQRDRALGSPVQLPDPESAVRQQLEELRRVLTEHVDCFEAIAFCHR